MRLILICLISIFVTANLFCSDKLNNSNLSMSSFSYPGYFPPGSCYTPGQGSNNKTETPQEWPAHTGDDESHWTTGFLVLTCASFGAGLVYKSYKNFKKKKTLLAIAEVASSAVCFGCACYFAQNLGGE